MFLFLLNSLYGFGYLSVNVTVGGLLYASQLDTVDKCNPAVGASTVMLSNNASPVRPSGVWRLAVRPACLLWHLYRIQYG